MAGIGNENSSSEWETLSPAALLVLLSAVRRRSQQVMRDTGIIFLAFFAIRLSLDWCYNHPGGAGHVERREPSGAGSVAEPPDPAGRPAVPALPHVLHAQLLEGRRIGPGPLPELRPEVATAGRGLS